MSGMAARRGTSRSEEAGLARRMAQQRWRSEHVPHPSVVEAPRGPCLFPGPPGRSAFTRGVVDLHSIAAAQQLGLQKMADATGRKPRRDA